MKPSDFESAQPAALQWLDDGSVAVTWEGGHESVYGRPYLRSQCPCASCRGTHGPPTTLVDETKPRFNIRSGPKPPPVEVAFKIVAADPIGQYGLKFTWGDMHDTGIYSYRYLRSICRCEMCLRQVDPEQEPSS